MKQYDLKLLLDDVASGKTSPDEAVLKLREAPILDLGFAQIDMHRELRQGVGEVIYGAGKTQEQILHIIQAMMQHGQTRILITRLTDSAAAFIQKSVDMTYDSCAHIGIVGSSAEHLTGCIAVVSAGTSDMPTAEEAALTAEFLGNRVLRIYDAGVAGLHRLLRHLDEMMSARVIVAVAGMEGALPSVIAGLVSSPVIAVPTSVGYGASLHGIAALLAMLNSCASGVSVVNIDNGFGAAYQASMINKLQEI